MSSPLSFPPMFQNTKSRVMKSLLIELTESSIPNWNLKATYLIRQDTPLSKHSSSSSRTPCLLLLLLLFPIWTLYFLAKRLSRELNSSALYYFRMRANFDDIPASRVLYCATQLGKQLISPFGQNNDVDSVNAKTIHNGQEGWWT